MGQADQSIRPSAQGQTMQIRRPIFCYHPMNVAPGGDHASSGGQLPDDAGKGATFRGRWKGKDGLAASGLRRAPQKVHLAANAGKNPVPYGIGTNLSR